MAVIKPTLKENKRYLLYKIYSESKYDQKEVFKMIRNTFQYYFGFIELEKAGLIFVSNISKNDYGVIRVERKYADKLRTCFVFIKELNGKKISIRSLLLSGVLDKIEEMINHDKN